ncbi:MAG TPA: tetratricopeptide repeat protein [Candidatus Polarisedimenticolaceae bacterium]|nr:tetratricopeptide repeat protein [Candidatus Polarisedimenticolaceae bacterium]
MATTKRINRKELDQDEFIEKVFDLGEWLESNWKQAAGVAVGVVAVVLLGVGWNAWRGRMLGQANVALGQGLELYAPQPKADGTTPPPKMAEAHAAFEKAAKLAGSRPLGDVARYYDALALIALDRPAEATPTLEKLASSDGPISAQAKVSLANAFAKKGDYDRAAALLQEVASKTGAAFPPDAALSMLGAMRARQGRNDDARKAYEDLVSRYPESGLAQEARQRVAELGGRLPASSSGTTR